MTQHFPCFIITNRYKKDSAKREFNALIYAHKLPRMAVLPFIIRNDIKKEILNLNDIVSEAITDIFSSNSRLEVISRTSTLSYKNESDHKDPGRPWRLHYAVMNKPDKAMDCLEKAADTKDPGLFFPCSNTIL